MSNSDWSVITVVIPAYNEEAAIEHVVGGVRQILPGAEVLVVDDGSSDQTAKRAISAGAVVVQHPYNKGNGASARTGIRHAKGEWVVMLDGDGQHDPEEIKLLLADTSRYDMVIGARQKEGQSSRVRGLGNGIYNRFASWLTGFKVEDLTSGFRAFRRKQMLPFLHLFPNRYSYPTTSTLVFLKAGHNVKYVQITCASRKGGKSGIRVIRDGGRFFLIIIKLVTLFSPMKIFLPVALFFGLLGTFYSLWTLSQGHFTNMGMLLLILAVLVFLMGLIAEMLASLHAQEPPGDQDR